MIRTVHRKMEFTTDDIKDALLEWMRSRDMPSPDNKTTTAQQFKITADGAEISWTDTI